MARIWTRYLTLLFTVIALSLNCGLAFAQEDDEDPIDDGDGGEELELVEEVEEDIENDAILNSGDLLCLVDLYQNYDTEEYSIEGYLVTYMESDDPEEEGDYEDIDSDELLSEISGKMRSLKKKIKNEKSPKKKKKLKRQLATYKAANDEIRSCIEGEMYPEEWEELL